jgi:hypothetical protein
MRNGSFVCFNENDYHQKGAPALPSIVSSRPAGPEAAPLFCLPVRIAELTPLDRD